MTDLAKISGESPVIAGGLRELVARTFSALDAADFDYCLLRGQRELFEADGYLEIDMLLRKNQLRLFAGVVRKLGFVEWPSWGHAPHHFFLAFDSAAGNWVKLDVVTDLMYGNPIRRYRVPLADACLLRRQKESVQVLSPAHEFFTLLLHGLLDKQQFRAEHRERLQQLRAVVETHEAEKFEIIRLVQKYLAPVFTWENIQRTLANNDWNSLLGKKQQLSQRFFLQQSLASQWRVVCARFGRLLRGAGFALFRRGISVALLAPDGAGKSTLSAALVGDRILKARGVYMGGNLAASTFTLPTTRFLHQAVKGKNGSANSKSKGNFLLKGLAFCNRLVEQWLRAGIAHHHLLRGRFVVFDRYIFDSWVNPKARTIWKRIRRFFFESILPVPNLVILLDAPGQLLYDRKGEHTPEWLEDQRQRYLQLREVIPNMHIVDATQSPETVRREAIALIWKEYGKKVK
jgi:thymidylate kinase